MGRKMADSDILYIAEMAKKLGKTESALRAMVHRDNSVDGARRLPESFKLGGRIAWRRCDVDLWLAHAAGRNK